MLAAVRVPALFHSRTMLQTSYDVVRIGPDVEVVLAIAIVLGIASFAGGFWVERSRNGDGLSPTSTENSVERERRSRRETSQIEAGDSAEGELADSAEQTDTVTDVSSRTNASDPDGKQTDPDAEQRDTGRGRKDDDEERVENADADATVRLDSSSAVPEPAEISDEDIAELETALESEATEDRITAIRTLGELGAERPELVTSSIEELKRLRLDSNADVSRAATEAINQINSAQE